MASTGEYYARLDGDRKVDIDVYHDKDGNVCVAIHDRDDGYTRVFNPDRIEVEHQQSSAIGGHCHWTELLFIEGEKRYVVRSAWSGNVFEEFIASIRHNVLGLRPTKLEWVWRAPEPMPPAYEIRDELNDLREEVDSLRKQVKFLSRHLCVSLP